MYGGLIYKWMYMPNQIQSDKNDKENVATIEYCICPVCTQRHFKKKNKEVVMLSLVVLFFLMLPSAYPISITTSPGKMILYGSESKNIYHTVTIVNQNNYSVEYIVSINSIFESEKLGILFDCLDGTGWKKDCMGYLEPSTRKTMNMSVFSEQDSNFTIDIVFKVQQGYGMTKISQQIPVIVEVTEKKKENNLWIFIGILAFLTLAFFYIDLMRGEENKKQEGFKKL